MVAPSGRRNLKFEISREVLAGPSREELFDALRLHHEGRTVTFTVANKLRSAGDPSRSATMYLRFTVDVAVRGIGVGGDGDSWILKLHDTAGLFGQVDLEANYCATKRTGRLRLA